MRGVRLLALAVLIGGWSGHVLAQDAPSDPVAERASAIWNTTKTVVDVLRPGYETIYDFKSGEWFQGLSASLWNFSSQEIYLASLRAGYAIDFKAYTGVTLNLPGLAKRFVPATIKGIATAGILDTVWRVVGKYAQVGFIGGYDFDAHDPLIGVSVGGQVSF